MPTYRIKCDVCGSQDDIYRSVANYNELPDCCGIKTHRVLMAPMVAADIQPYRSMIDGRIINSRSSHRTHLRDNGCIEIGNEHQPKDKTEITLSPESERQRRELIIHKVNSLSPTA